MDIRSLLYLRLKLTLMKTKEVSFVDNNLEVRAGRRQGSSHYRYRNSPSSQLESDIYHPSNRSSPRRGENRVSLTQTLLLMNFYILYSITSIDLQCIKYTYY